jgi:tetratricopeptide (TPR) repeat protein
MFGDGGVRGQYLDAHLLSAMLRAGRGQVRLGLDQLLEAPDDPRAHAIRTALMTLPYFPSPNGEPGGPFPVVPPDLSRSELESALDPADPNHGFLLGLVAAAFGDMDAAAAVVTELQNVTGLNPMAAELAVHNGRVLEAHLAWIQGDPAGALLSLGNARTQLHPLRPAPNRGYVEAHERFLRGESLLALGRQREALQWFGGFPEPGASDLHYIGITTLRRAQIHDALGERGNAIAAYERFLDLWPSPDPELAPMVEGAQEALLRLRD